MEIRIDKDDTLELLNAIFGLGYDTNNRKLMEAVNIVKEFVENDNGEMDDVHKAEQENGEGNRFIIE